MAAVAVGVLTWREAWKAVLPRWEEKNKKRKKGKNRWEEKNKKIDGRRRSRNEKKGKVNASARYADRTHGLQVMNLTL